jgi:hypothetical protein
VRTSVYALGTDYREVSNLDRLLPWIAIAAGVLALAVAIAKGGGSEKGGHPDRSLLPSWIAVGAMYGLAYGFRSMFFGLPDVAHGFLFGVIAVRLAMAVDGRAGRSPLAALGLATALAGGALLMPQEMRQSLWLGTAVGAGLAAACASLAESAQGTSRLAAFAIATLAAASVLGSYRDGVDRAAAMPAAIGTIAVIVMAALKLGSPSKWIRWAIVVVALLGGAKLLAAKYLFYGASFNVALGAVASAAIVAWILDDDDGTSPGPFVVCTVIWLAWSTVAFGLMQGLGIAISAMFAASFLFAAESYRGLLSMAVLVPLAFYRIFLEAYPTESRHIDVGQQYSMMGIVIGAALPTALAAWIARASSRTTGLRRPFMALIAGAIVMALLIAADFILGSRGVIGVIIGLAIAPLVAGLIRGERLGTLAAIGSLAAAVVASFKFVAPYILVERETKIQLLGWGIGSAVILIAIASWLMRDSAGASAHENTA